MTSQSSSSKSKEGIDIRAALDILAARTENNFSAQDVPSEARSMGQRIDLLPPEADPATADDEAKQAEIERQASIKERRKEVCAQIQEEIKSMTVKELLQSVMKTQQDRVVVYKQFDSGLTKVLNTGNVTTYPAICAEATASFSVLSDTINAVCSALESKHRRTELTGLLKKLQKHEQEKLNLTAALHLEMIREKNQENNNNVAAENHDRISKLLSQSVRSLRGKIAGCIEQINEVLEEVRYAIMEEDET